MAREHNKEYPTLLCIAYELFAIPCSSAEPERVFSGYLVILDLKINYRCGLTITDIRSRSLPDVVEAIECLQWWMKGGFLDDGRISLEDENADKNSSEKGDNDDVVIMKDDEDIYGF
jgi:hAT family C-terminal dimerisation region